MPKDRERAINPAAAQRKTEKQKALKKGKAAVVAQRNERLAHRNPDRLQRQIDELRALQAEAGRLSVRNTKALEDLERDVARVRKAKNTVGHKVLSGSLSGDHGARSRETREIQNAGRSGILGKRERDWNRYQEDDGSETDESVREIPMPKDTPPPLPLQRHRLRKLNLHPKAKGDGESNPNEIPLGRGPGGGEREPHTLPRKLSAVTMHAQAVYEAKPAVRDLRKEAVSRFVPSVVQKKLNARKGDVRGKLLEEEDMQRLVREGYGFLQTTNRAVEPRSEQMAVGETEVRNDTLDEEEQRFERELMNVQMEDVEDETL